MVKGLKNNSNSNNNYIWRTWANLTCLPGCCDWHTWLWLTWALLSVCWLAVSLTWVYRRTSWSQFLTCSSLKARSLSHLMPRGRDDRAPEDRVHSSQAVNQAAVCHSSCTMSVETRVSTVHLMWHSVTSLTQLLLLRLHQQKIMVCTSLITSWNQQGTLRNAVDL